MTAYQTIGAGDREVVEIDALLRALQDLRNWSATATARQTYVGDRGCRLRANALRLREAAWADCLAAAYRLFEIDAIHAVWREAAIDPR